MKTKHKKNHCRSSRPRNRLALASDIQVRPAARPSLAPLRRLKTILVPVDFSAPSLKALRYAVPFAEQFGATICLVHVLEPVAFPLELADAPSARLSADPVAQARKQLFELSSREIEELIPINVLVPRGKPATEIVRLARELPSDLIVIATHGYKGIKHLLLGSTAEKVVRDAPCPVLVVREQEHEFV